MEQIQCGSCGFVNPAGATVCADCGAALVPVIAARVDRVIVEPVERVVVAPRSSSNGLIFAALGLVALLVIGFLMYQLGKNDTENDNLNRSARNERVPTPSDSRSTTPTTSAPMPTVTAPAPVTVSPTPLPTTTLPTTTLPPPPASEAPTAAARAERAKYSSQVDPILREWDTLLASTRGATGVALDRTLERMNDLQRRASRVSAPAAAASAHGHLVTAMTSEIDALRTAPTGEDPTTTEAFRRASDLYSEFQTEYDTFQSSTP